MSLGTGSLTGRNGHGVVVYFAVSFDHQPESYGVWENGRMKPGQASVQAGGSTAAAYYGEDKCCRCLHVHTVCLMLRRLVYCIRLMYGYHHTYSLCLVSTVSNLSFIVLVIVNASIGEWIVPLS